MFKDASSIKVLFMQIILAALSFACYYNAWGIYPAIFIILGVGWHEYCHIMAANKLGLLTGGFYFVPFVGAFAPIKDPPTRQRDAATISLAGPLGGGLLAIVSSALYLTTSIPIFGKAAFFMLIMNMFNLLPFAVLDGGQVADSIFSSINKGASLTWHVVSFTLTVGFFIWFKPALLLIVGPFGIMKLVAMIVDYREYKKRNTWYEPFFNLTPMTKKQMAITVATWFAAFAILAINLKLLTVYGLSISGIFEK
jgi:Zn-dependent protease